MTGNKANVSGLMSAYYSDMGGFAYLQGNSKLTLAGENGATLTIGDANAADKTIDSIASIGGYENSANELILKGNVVINSSLEAFSDKITVADNANVTMATGFASDRISLQADINKYPDEAYDDYGWPEQHSQSQVTRDRHQELFVEGKRNQCHYNGLRSLQFD